MGGDAAAAADFVHMMGQGLTLDLTFLAVSSGEGDQIHIAPVHKIHIDGHNTLEVDAVAAAVVDTGRAHNDIRFLKYRVEECHPDFCNGIPDGKFQGLDCILFSGEGSRKAVQRERTIIDSVGQITAVKRKTAVAVLHFDGVDPEVTLLLGREFLGLGVEGKGTLLQGVIGIS